MMKPDVRVESSMIAVSVESGGSKGKECDLRCLI
jgi:hypothetical protein